MEDGGVLPLAWEFALEGPLEEPPDSRLKISETEVRWVLKLALMVFQADGLIGSGNELLEGGGMVVVVSTDCRSPSVPSVEFERCSLDAIDSRCWSTGNQCSTRYAPH